jgi:hypothetical protein
MQLDAGTSGAILEAAGAILYDPEFLADVENSGNPGGLLRDNGFQISDEEANRIQTQIRTAPAKNAAQQFVSLLWSGSVCLGRLKMYGAYSHTNY